MRSLFLFLALVSCASSTTEDPAIDAQPLDASSDAVDTSEPTDARCDPGAGPICCAPGNPPTDPVCTGPMAWQCPIGMIPTNRTTGCSDADAGADSD